MTEFSRIALVGTGSLARAVAYSLSTLDTGPLEVVVVGRKGTRVDTLCTVAGARAASAGHEVRFRPERADVRDPGFAAIVENYRPVGILLCASHQSPAESRTGGSAWTELLRTGGYGLTLPLHADLAIAVGRTAERNGAWFVNACLPDLVNPLLAQLGVPVLCGIGNVATLAAGLQAELGLRDQKDLALLGHHLHLHGPPGADEALSRDELRAWLHGDALDKVTEMLDGIRAVGPQERDHVAGVTAARTVLALTGRGPYETSLPGPLGLPGGYPVRVDEAAVSLRLPPGLARDEAVELNQHWSRLDGAVVDGDRVRFGDEASEALRGKCPELVGGFDVIDVNNANALMLELRDRLRQPRQESA